MIEPTTPGLLPLRHRARVYAKPGGQCSYVRFKRYGIAAAARPWPPEDDGCRRVAREPTRAESASNWRRDMAMDGTIAKLRVEGKTTLVRLLRPPLVVNWYSRGSIEYAFRFAELMVLYCERAARLYTDVEYLPPTDAATDNAC